MSNWSTDAERLDDIRRTAPLRDSYFTPDAVLFLLAKLDEARKENADLRAEYMLVESALVDAMGALQFYEGGPAAREYTIAGAVTLDAGRRARWTLDRLFDRLLAFARIQKLKGE